MAHKKKREGLAFSTTELLIAVAIIVVLAVMVLLYVHPTIKAAEVSQAGATQRQMTKAIQAYILHMGFYPPDVNRGWDPGFVRPLPWNPDAEAGDPPPGGFSSPGTNCGHCPANWQDIVQKKWNGPYLPNWPRFTPWGGKYDYNYWGQGATRSGCVLPPGVYVGVQGDYNNNNKIPANEEAEMIKKGFDYEQCLNGESQMLLQPL